MEKSKTTELEIIFNKADSKNRGQFLMWLKQSREKTIRKISKHIRRYPHKGFQIKSDNDLRIAESLCEKLIYFSTETPKLLSDELLIFQAIIRKAKLEAIKFKNTLEYQFHIYEARLLEKTNKKMAVEFLLRVLGTLDEPYNNDTSYLYEMLLDLDEYCVGTSRLEQRRLLSLTIRDLNLPPFYADDNIFLISGRKLMPVGNIQPDEIERMIRPTSRNYIKPNQAYIFRDSITWEFLVFDKGQNIEIHKNGSAEVSTLSGNSAIIFKSLIKQSNLNGITNTQITLGIKSRKPKDKTSKNKSLDHFRKLIRDAFDINDKDEQIINITGGITSINPNIAILLIKPSVRQK